MERDDVNPFTQVISDAVKKRSDAGIGFVDHAMRRYLRGGLFALLLMLLSVAPRFSAPGWADRAAPQVFFPNYVPKDLVVIAAYGAMNPAVDMRLLEEEPRPKPDGYEVCVDNYFETCTRRGNSFPDCYKGWLHLVEEGQECAEDMGHSKNCGTIRRVMYKQVSLAGKPPHR